MEKVYLISTCIKINRDYSIFHFKGFFKGERITQVHLMGSEFSKDCEYLLKISTLGVEKNILYGKALKVKKL